MLVNGLNVLHQLISGYKSSLELMVGVKNSKKNTSTSCEMELTVAFNF